MLNQFVGHPAACPWTGGLRRRRAAFERAFRPLWSEAGVHAQEHPLVRELVPGIRAGDSRQSDVVVRGLRLGRGLPVVGEMCMMSAPHQDGTPWARADDYDGVAIERGIAAKHSTYPELVSSDRVKFLVLVCEEGGRWSPEVYRVVKDLVDLKTAPLHSLLRRSGADQKVRSWRRPVGTSMVPPSK